MTDLRSFIVRIYPRESGGVGGVVEDPETGLRCAFRSARELWELVAARDPGDSPTDASSKPQRKERKP